MTHSTPTVDLDTTIAALQQGLTSVPADEAVAIIDSWQQQLQGHDLAEDLGELKQALLNGDTASIAEILVDLGEDTSGEAASSVSDEISPKIKQLGELLMQAGRSLQ
jgi:hypothetical protein